MSVRGASGAGPHGDGPAPDGRRPAKRHDLDWRTTYAELTLRPLDELSAAELDLLSDARFWLDDPDESIAVRRRAYRAHVDAGDVERAALAAWRLFYDHFLVGEAAAANGWLARCRRHVAGDEMCRAGGWLGVAEADVALGVGDVDAALVHARRAREVGERLADPDLRAMAAQAEGRVEIGGGATARGLELLDEAMVAVVSGETSALYTGWVYCNVVSTCFDLADLGRASEWSEAAMRWCASLDHGHMYPGLCRVYAVELACLRGAWDTAAANAERACAELIAFDARYAGEAHYLVGELRRLRGDEAGAEAGYREAHRLGRPPQPGLGLLRLAQGRIADALHGLRQAARPGSSAPLPHARLLAAHARAELAGGDLDRTREVVAELHDLARRSGSPVVTALGDGCRGALTLAAGDPAAALAHLRRSWSTLHELGLRHDAACVRIEIGRSARLLGDADTARLEWEAALATFDELGAAPDGRVARRLLAGHEGGADDRPAGAATGDGSRPGPAPAPLTDREMEVMRLVAAGSTNREVAEALHLSPHTVSRHLSNIFTKIDVTSRAAATAWAYEHDLLAPDRSGR